MDNQIDKSELSFDIEKWIKEHLYDVSSLNPYTIKAVGDFVVLWNLFEGGMCNTNANVQKFQGIAQKLAELSKIEESVNKSLAFYQKRYLNGQEIKGLFEGLKLNKEMGKLVETVLKEENSDLEKKIVALLTIVLRIRNHIFHGLKYVGEWSKQTENISEASKVLLFVIEGGIKQQIVKWG